MQRGLVLSKGLLVASTMRMANQWHMLLEEEQARLSLVVQADQEIPDPFVTGDPVHDTENNVFAGRQDIVAKLEQDLLGALILLPFYCRTASDGKD